MKKWKINWEKTAFIAFGAALFVIAVHMYQKVSELTNQLAYLQDSTSVILSDMGNLQSNIKKTLQEEASMVEDYSITVKSLDFVRKTYHVEVSVVPKEYTDKTQVSIYFGTLECPLEQGKYAYTGSVDLPLEKDFDGNITFLLSNGRKKATEVLSDYQGLELNLDNVLSAKLEKAPAYRNGTLRLDSICEVALEGYSRFEFESLDMVAMLDDKMINVTNLLEQMQGTQDYVSDGEAAVSTEKDDLQDSQKEDTVYAISGAADGEFTYEMPLDTKDSEEESDLPEKKHIRIYVRARTTDGYRFEYTVFEGDYLTADEKMDEDSFRWNTKNAVYDHIGNELELDINELKEVQ